MILEEQKAHLHRQLVKLGDMIGEGLHHEPGGKWINIEYKRVLKALGLQQPYKNNRAHINKAMDKRVAEVFCPNCKGVLNQTRAGSKRARCKECNNLYQLLK